MYIKRWIVAGVIIALLLAGAFQISGMAKQSGQGQSHSTTNLFDSINQLVYMPLALKDPVFNPSITPTLTPSKTPSITDTPTPTEVITDGPTPTFTLTPTFSGTPPALCEWHYLPNKTVSFSTDLGPYSKTFTIQNNMTVSVVRVSANLSANNCTVGQFVTINGSQVGDWTYSATNNYKIYTETHYDSLPVHVGNSILYRAYAINFGCTGWISGASNYVEVCGNP
jgi:hypothetical protein